MLRPPIHKLILRPSLGHRPLSKQPSYVPPLAEPHNYLSPLIQTTIFRPQPNNYLTPISRRPSCTLSIILRPQPNNLPTPLSKQPSYATLQTTIFRPSLGYTPLAKLLSNAAIQTTILRPLHAGRPQSEIRVTTKHRSQETNLQDQPTNRPTIHSIIYHSNNHIQYSRM